MMVHVDDVVMLPGYAPYPRYGRVTKVEDDGRVHVSAVQCGDPRCAAEHQHGDSIWQATALLDARAYQARAGWEEGRTSSPNAAVS